MSGLVLKLLCCTLNFQSAQKDQFGLAELKDHFYRHSRFWYVSYPLETKAQTCLLIFISVKEIVLYTGKPPLVAPLIQ